jgi:hypothetical protein
MYYPQQPKEPSGCMQTLVITRMIFATLLVPMGLIFGAIIAVLLTFYALSIHPLLALLVIVIAGAVLYALAKWESRRISRNNPPDDL